MAIIKDRHARIIIVRPEITLHLEAGYIFAGCSRRNRFFLQFGGGPYMLCQPTHVHMDVGRSVLHTGAPRSRNRIVLLLGRGPWVAGNNRAYPKGVHLTTSSGRS